MIIYIRPLEIFRYLNKRAVDINNQEVCNLISENLVNIVDEFSTNRESSKNLIVANSLLSVFIDMFSYKIKKGIVVNDDIVTLHKFYRFFRVF